MTTNDETVWLVESQLPEHLAQGQARYHYVIHTGKSTWTIAWTTDPYMARRFTDQSAAEIIVEFLKVVFEMPSVARDHSFAVEKERVLWLIQKAPVVNGVPWYQRTRPTMGGLLLDWTWDTRLALRFDSEKEATNWIDTFKPINNISATAVAVNTTVGSDSDNAVWLVEGKRNGRGGALPYFQGYTTERHGAVEKWTTDPAEAAQYQNSTAANQAVDTIKKLSPQTDCRAVLRPSHRETRVNTSSSNREVL